MEFWKHFFQICVVVIPSYDVNSFRMYSLLVTDGVIQVSFSHASISIRRYVHSIYKSDSKLSLGDIQGLHLRVTNSTSGEQWLAVTLALVNQLLFT